MVFLRWTVFVLLVAATSLWARADDILFFGNSFTTGAMAPSVDRNGGVPALVKEIAIAKGKDVTTDAVTAGGVDWSYHLAQPATDKALGAKNWTWVVLQDQSVRPTHLGRIDQFLRDGEVFSERIARTCPHAGIILYETWARPAGAFYKGKNPSGFSGPVEMMDELHESFSRLRDDLVAKKLNSAVRIARVGTAFARVDSEYPAITLNAADQHHATTQGYYLAALVIYETMYHESVKGAPTEFYHGEVIISAEEAAKLQGVADEVAGGSAN